MIYIVNTRSIITNLKAIIFPLFFAVLALFFLGDNLRAVIVITLITLVLLIPQIYLAIQYIKFISFKSFEINYDEEQFHIKKSNIDIHKNFSDLKTIQYHKADVPISYLSLAFTLCEHFYYYRLEFKDGEIYYLTNLLSPNPKIKEDGVFYPYYFKVDRKYATIKS